MSKVQVKKQARRSKSRTTVASASPASLPPPGTDPAIPTPLEIAAAETPAESLAITPENPAKPEKPPFWKRGKDSKAYASAMKILTLRAAGVKDADIANALGIAEQSVWNYCYMAGRNGWLTDELANAKDTIEFKIMPKVMRELEAGLEDDSRNEKTMMPVRTLVALKIAEGTVFRKFEQPSVEHSQNNIIAIKIETVQGPPQQIREGTIGGVPAYQDAEVAADGGES